MEIRMTNDAAVLDFTHEGNEVKLKVRELLQRASATEFEAIALANGYIRLQPGQVVVDGNAIADHCAACDEEGMTVVCDGCVLKPIRDRIKEARDE